MSIWELLLWAVAAYLAYALIVVAVTAVIAAPFAYARAYCQWRFGWFGGRAAIAEAIEAQERRSKFDREMRELLKRAKQ
jgi:hypothetical protein